MTIYTTGTVSVANGDAVVTGSGTAWAVALIGGGMFSSAGVSVPILSVDSDTSLTLAYAWPGTTATGAVYAIARENSEAADIVDLNDRLSRVLVTLSLVGITPNSSGTIAERDALTLAVGDKGFLFLHAELGYDFEFYRWSGSAWVGPFATRGVAGPDGPAGVIGVWRGPWLTATAYEVGDAVSQSGNSYICVTAHTSGTFAADLAASKWQLVAQKGDAGVVQSIVAGGNVTVDNTDPANPVVASNMNFQRVVGNSAYAIMSASTKMSQIADLRDWAGLDLTGATDMTSIMQAAVNATAAVGVKLNIPGGKITLGSTVTVPKYANIEGAGSPATGATGLPSASPMTFFHLAHLGVGFDLTGGVSDGPRRVAGFGTYRDQAAPGVGWTPIGAAADIQFTGVYDATAEDLFFYNPTVAIKAIGNTGNNAGNGRITLRKLRGQPLSQGINMTHVYDVVFIDDIAWWPYWSLDANVLSYTHNNAQAMVLGRVDWPIIGRIFSIRMKDGLYITNQGVVGTLPTGTTTNLHADNIGADNCQRGLVIDAGASAATLSIDRLICTNPTADTPPFIAVAGTNAIVDIRDLTGANTNGSLIDISGSGNKVRVGTSHSYGIDTDANGTPEFNVANGNELTLMAKPITSAGTVYSTTGTIRTPDWRAFTPTITTSSGTITTLGTLACKYKLEGTTCHFDYEIPITTNGTGAGVLSATLPIQAKKTGGGPAGYVAANMLKGVIAGGVSQRVDITTYNNAYPGADGVTIRIAGSYEIA
jgi:hypothetical protein